MSKPKPKPRVHVLVVIDAAGLVEVFAESHVQVRVERLIRSTTRRGSLMAEDILEWGLPRAYRQLYFQGKRRASGTTRPLYPSTAYRARQAAKLIEGLEA